MRSDQARCLPYNHSIQFNLLSSRSFLVSLLRVRLSYSGFGSSFNRSINFRSFSLRSFHFTMAAPLTLEQQQALAELNRLQSMKQEMERQVNEANAAAHAAQQEAERLRRLGASSSSSSSSTDNIKGMKPPTLNKFSGKTGFEVDSWIRALHRTFAWHPATTYPENPPAERIKVATTYFEGAAESWWEYMNEEQRRQVSVSWQTFVQALYSRFRPIQPAEFARNRLRNLRQRGDLSVYIEALLS